MTFVRVVIAATAELPDDDPAAVEATLSDAGFSNVTAWPVESFIDATAAAVPLGRHAKRFEGALRLALRRTLVGRHHRDELDLTPPP